MKHQAGNSQIGIFQLTAEEYSVMVAMNLHGYRLVAATPAKVQTIMELHRDFKEEIAPMSLAFRRQSERLDQLRQAVQTARGKAKRKLQDELTAVTWEERHIGNMLDRAWAMVRAEASDVMRSR